MWEIINNTLKTAYDRAQIRRIINENKQIDDDWDISLDRIVMLPNDFHRNGSQGDVFLGRLSNSPVAVKRVRDQALANIRHLKDLNHKNIVKFIGVSQDPRRNYYYIIMEWCNNGTLAQKLHDDHPIISPAHLCEFAQQIANGVKYLHSKNIIHRDLKPANILLTRNYEIKISDFGTHKVFGGDRHFSKSQIGTYAYMAPEVIRGEAYSFPIDAWSYGVVLWEMFVGLRPYHNLDSSAVVWAVGNNAFHLPIPLDFPDGLSFILKRCWHETAAERITFQQICMMLKGATPEFKKIPKERWPPTQASWKKEVKSELKKHLQFKTDQDDDKIQDQKSQDDAEKKQREREKMIRCHMQLQEASLLLMREQRELDIQKESFAKEKELLARERDAISKDREILRDVISQFMDTLPEEFLSELSRRGIITNN